MQTSGLRQRPLLGPSLSGKRSLEQNIFRTGTTLAYLDRGTCPATPRRGAWARTTLLRIRHIAQREKKEKGMERKTGSSSRKDHFELMIRTSVTVDFTVASFAASQGVDGLGWEKQGVEGRREASRPVHTPSTERRARGVQDTSGRSFALSTD